MPDAISFISGQRWLVLAQSASPCSKRKTDIESACAQLDQGLAMPKVWHYLSV